LANTWMNNPQYLAQLGHSLGACLVMVVAGMFGGMFAAWIALPSIVVAALIKEYWYDATYEVPTQTFADNTMDFGFFCLGAGVGLGIDCLKFYVLSP
jgi:hypothetical protein